MKCCFLENLSQGECFSVTHFHPFMNIWCISLCVKRHTMFRRKEHYLTGGVILYTHPDVACGKIEQGSRFLLLAEFTTVIWLPYPLVQWYCILLLDIPVNPSSKRFNSRLCCFYERWLSLALACLSKCSRGDVIIRIPQRESGKGSTGFPIGTCIYMIY